MSVLGGYNENAERYEKARGLRVEEDKEIAFSK